MDSRDSLENVESKWVGEIADNCQGVKLVLVALKCDLREAAGDDNDRDHDQTRPEKNAAGSGGGGGGGGGSGSGEGGGDFIQYPEGLAVAQRINALRYLECSAKMNRGVNEAFTEAARVALSANAKGAKEGSRCVIL